MATLDFTDDNLPFWQATPEDRGRALNPLLLNLMSPEQATQARQEVMRSQMNDAQNIGDLFQRPQQPSAIDKLFGLGNTERFQTWPERMVRSAVTLPKQVISGEVQTQTLDPASGEIRTSPEMIERTQDLANLAMGGGVPFAAKGAVGATGGKLVQPAIKETGPLWHSAVENAVVNSKQQSASPEQWLGMINNHPGVKQEELNWLGVPEYLASQKGPVTKKDLQSYIDNHKVEVKDALNTNKDQSLVSDDFNYLDHRSDVVNDWMENKVNPNDVKIVQEGGHFRLKANDHDLGSFGSKEMAETHKKQFLEDALSQNELRLENWGDKAARAEAEKRMPGRYSEYQLPGGKNYGELLLTMPTGVRRWVNGEVITPEELSTPFGRDSADRVGSFDKEPYQSPHWNEPNVLAHVRFNDRTINGKKTLFLEEVQSDWHQTGRKSGYKDKEKFGESGEEAINRAMYERQSSVPDAPFKKSWPDLILKRMIRHAADNGYDAIAWTPGEVQAKRWRGTGEEGHEKFYDEILVNAANKLAKAYGEKVGERKITKPETTLSFQESQNRRAGNKPDPSKFKQSVHFLKLPQSMKDTAQRKGMALFSGGNMLIPVDQEHPQ